MKKYLDHQTLAWAMSHFSHRPREPGYYIVDWRILYLFRPSLVVKYVGSYLLHNLKVDIFDGKMYGNFRFLKSYKWQNSKSYFENIETLLKNY